MHSPQTRANLEHCRAVLAEAVVPDELRNLASNLLEHLLDMHDANCLRISVFLLAVDSLELVPGLEECAAELRATASREMTG